MKSIILLLLCGCALGALASHLYSKSFNPKRKQPQITNAPRNCNPKKIPRIRNFDPNSISGSASLVLSTPQDFVNVTDAADQGSRFTVTSYKRPDGTKEAVLAYNHFVVFQNGFCVNGTAAYKFGKGQDSATFTNVNTFGERVDVINIYVLAVDASTGTAAYYFEALLDGVYEDSISYIFITVTDPSRSLDLSGVNGALVQFCGKEALKDGFFEVFNRNTSIECNPDVTAP